MWSRCSIASRLCCSRLCLPTSRLSSSPALEANDLALQMARNYTNRKDLVVVDGSFHGTGNLLADISPRAFKISPEGKKPWVHVVPVPDMYRGPYTSDDPEAGEKYFQDAKRVLELVSVNNHEIAGFICEPVMVVHGMVIPPHDWLGKMYSYIRELGGIVVADEIQCGMGRTGETFWGFQGQNAVPDILTVGKPLGNGHPIGAVITSRKIAATIKNAEQIYKCDPVGAAIAATVMTEMKDRQLMDNARRLGNMMAEGFQLLQRSHPIIGDIRHKGIVIGVDIVYSSDCMKPATEMAEEISNGLRKERLLVGCEGEYKNVLLFLPALCITDSDVECVIKTLDQVLRCVELSYMDDIYDIINSPSPGELEPSTSFGVQPSPDNHIFISTSQHPYDALD
ncbi:ethanolamine-phosphate phospho-lyase-like isoform X2 [Macrosteles quadrilineatus]|uniref:ethanolamine-phosphate phospho-lyase-like isoform X2 n=1 Tax=Macrosteles quadrilineatus TaxID=74068 RepID=UPI0023E30883|nr:ethanolamine-phosphate phospho-lyase-like isoform X2 [Macrosteles quadrilineatus]